MKRLLAVVPAAALTIAIAVITACESSALPGTALGTFAVTATLTGNTCGSALGVTSPWTFDTTMSKDGSTLYWQQASATAVSGVLDSSNKTEITATTTTGADGSTCVLTETDVLDVTLDSATAPTTATGTLAFTFAASSTADCAVALSANGGSYQTLPCTVSYSFTGTKQ